MVEYTPEQMKEISDRIGYEQFRITADNDYRDMIEAITFKVNQGFRDPYALEVARKLYSDFKQQFFPAPPKKEDEKKDGE